MKPEKLRNRFILILLLLVQHGARAEEKFLPQFVLDKQPDIYGSSPNALHPLNTVHSFGHNVSKAPEGGISISQSLVSGNPFIDALPLKASDLTQANMGNAVAETLKILRPYDPDKTLTELGKSGGINDRVGHMTLREAVWEIVPGPELATYIFEGAPQSFWEGRPRPYRRMSSVSAPAATRLHEEAMDGGVDALMAAKSAGINIAKYYLEKGRGLLVDVLSAYEEVSNLRQKIESLGGSTDPEKLKLEARLKDVLILLRREGALEALKLARPAQGREVELRLARLPLFSKESQASVSDEDASTEAGLVQNLGIPSREVCNLKSFDLRDLKDRLDSFPGISSSPQSVIQSARGSIGSATTCFLHVQGKGPQLKVNLRQGGSSQSIPAEHFQKVLQSIGTSESAH
jgi:hypothetical protein